MRWLRPWTWVPSLYYVQGLPYVVANNVSVALFKSLGVGNAEIAFLTSWLSLVWAFKALWSPFVDGVSTKRRWTVSMQLALAPVALALAGAVGLPDPVLVLVGLFFLMGFVSATHDVAADGFYMLGLDADQQAGFVGVRSTFWRLALITAEGGMVAAAGMLGRSWGAVGGWQLALVGLAALFGGAAVFHALTLPAPAADVPREVQGVAGEGTEAVRSFLAKPGLVRALVFIVFYRFAENHLAKLVVPFMVDAREQGGLGLTLEEVGFIKGVVGASGLVVGGLLGGVVIARFGLRRSLWPMVAALNLPDLLYVWLAITQPLDRAWVAGAVGLESFGYGFGFTAYMFYLMQFAEGPYKTSHYAFATGGMALSVWLAQFWSGWAQVQLGYVGFFAWVCLLTVPGVAVAGWVRRELPA